MQVHQTVRGGLEENEGLSRVWLQTLGDGLVRADQVIGIDVHQTPALTGKPSHWLLDIVLPASTGNGHAATGLSRRCTAPWCRPDLRARRAAPCWPGCWPNSTPSTPPGSSAPRSSPIGVPAAKVGRRPGPRTEPRLPVGCGCDSRRSRSRTRQAHRRGVPLNAGSAGAVTVPGSEAERRDRRHRARPEGVEHPALVGHYRVGQRVERAPAQAAGLLRLAHPRLARPAGAREEEVHPLVDGPVVAVGAVHRGERHHAAGSMATPISSAASRHAASVTDSPRST